MNRGVLRAHNDGIVTSASLMVRWPAAREAVAISRECPRLSVGLHLDFGEWTFENGEWLTVDEVVDLEDEASVAAEVDRQVELFQELVGRNPSHIDSHQHVHRNPQVRRPVVDVARRLAVPLRHFSPDVRYRGDFYGQSNKGQALPDAISVPALIQFLSRLEPGLHELGCHPAMAVEFDTMYRDERMLELMTLCDARVRSAIDCHRIDLCSFCDIGAMCCNDVENLLQAQSSGGHDA